MTRAVLWVGGWAHPGDDIVDAMQRIASPRKIKLDVVSDPTLAAASVSRGSDLLIVGACWFSMTDERYDDAQRAAHAVTVDEDLRKALAELSASGCGLLALHTAVICFDGANEWSDWLGGSWNWKTSWHPDPEPVVVQPAHGPLPFEEFTVVDELYQGLDVDSSAQIVAASNGNDPLVWLHNRGASRVGVNVLGHDHRSLQHPAHAALNAHLFDWVLG